MAVEVMAWAFEQDLPPAKKLLLLAIANHASPDGSNAWPSVATLARKTSISTRYVQRLLRELEAEGWISTEVKQGGGRRTTSDRRPNLYRVNLERGEPQVTSSAPRGEPQFTPEVNPSSPREVNPSSPKPSLEPSMNRPLAAKGRERAPDALWDALVAVVGLDASQLTRSRRGALNAARKQLAEVDATPEEVHARAKAYRERWPDATLTESALVKHWAALGTQAAPAHIFVSDPDCPECGGTWWVYLSDGTVTRCSRCTPTDEATR